MPIPTQRPCEPNQRGVATIFITVVLLLAAGLIALYTSRSSVVEQRLSANEVRAKQALAAANAGIDHALAHMRKGGIYQDDVTDDGNYVLDVLTPAAVELKNGGSGTLSSYRVVFSDPAAAVPVCPPTRAGALVGTVVDLTTRLTTIVAISCGWSDDNGSVQRVVQRLASTPSLAGTVSTPLVTAGGTSVPTGTTTVFNYFNDLTVWSGKDLSVGKGPGGGTCNAYVRDVSVAGGHQTPVAGFDYRGDAKKGGPFPDGGYVCSTDGTTVGHDSVSNDTSLSSKTPEQFFEHFMGHPVDKYKEATGAWVGSIDELTKAVVEVNQVLWVNVPAGGAVSLPKFEIGTKEKPVILVIDGDLELTGAGGEGVVNGFVFVKGDVSGAANQKFYGSLVVAGDYKSTGTVEIIYDPNALSGAAQLGKATRLHGTWRDW